MVRNKNVRCWWCGCDWMPWTRENATNGVVLFFFFWKWLSLDGVAVPICIECKRNFSILIIPIALFFPLGKMRRRARASRWNLPEQTGASEPGIIRRRHCFFFLFRAHISSAHGRVNAIAYRELRTTLMQRQANKSLVVYVRRARGGLMVSRNHTLSAFLNEKLGLMVASIFSIVFIL